MYMFKMIPREERRALKRIAKSFLVLLTIFTILLYFSHDPEPKCKPMLDKKSCKLKE